MKSLKLLGIIAFLAVIGYMVLGCSDSGTTDTSCTHNWDWVTTKVPNSTEEGIETYKCLHCGQTGTTRPVPTVVKIISAVSISITAPVNGVVPNNTATTTDSGYTLGTVSWTPSDNPFLGGKEYIATVSLTANNSYTFTGLNSVNINGQTGTVTGNTGTNATISYTFPITPTKTVSSIIIKTEPYKLTYIHNEHLDLTGLVVILNYDDTTTEEVSAANFSGKNINANPAHGNILDKTAHNSNPVFITYGNLSQNTNNLIINNKEISSVEINITAPVKNATPTVTATGTGDYSLGNVTWSQAHGKFLGGEIYTASVTLTANSGFVFTGLTSVTINGHNNEISNNTGSTITLIHTFSRTDERAVYDLDIRTQPTRLIYTHGNPLDLTSLFITLKHDDGTTEDVAAADFEIKNINAIPADGNTLTRVNHNGQPIIITYGELTVFTNKLTVNPKVITFSIEPISTVLYTGNAHTPVVVVRDGDLLLSLGTDYTVGYANNINKGTATVTVTGIGNYEGSSVNSTFIINKAAGIFGNPSAVNITYTSALTLADVLLTTGYSWNTPTLSLNAGNGQSFPATYINPNGNYESVSGNIIVNVAKATGVFGNPSAINVIYSPTLTLANIALPTDYIWNLPATSLNAGNNQLFSATYTNPNGNYEPANGNITVNVAKAAGSTVNRPELDTRTINSITVKTVTTPANGQTVEYSINTVNIEPVSGWQDSTTLSGLKGNTVYYIFARAKENNNYNGGTAISNSIATLNSYEINFQQIVDDNTILPWTGIVNPISISHTSGTSIIISLNNFHQYTHVEWHITRKDITQINTVSFELKPSDFERIDIGTHSLTVEVVKDGIPYNRTIPFQVTN